MRKFLLVSTGNLGRQHHREGALRRGVKRDIDCFGADAGTADAGPILGADIPHNEGEMSHRVGDVDLEITLVEPGKKKVP
ncbi:hypothetical protein [Aminivibrio sp.]|uniref:hypothetical protein n=1 Tax=Aminivibrio sp. TaxID=1872489 RepID=UPI00345EFD33